MRLYLEPHKIGCGDVWGRGGEMVLWVEEM